MQATTLEVDYLVVGAGASGMAFADDLVAASDATVAIVDRRDAPGGHWNDAYPFVRLHQPSAFYGVSSLPLGDDAIDTTGPNAGLYEVATGHEVSGYFDHVMDRLQRTGRVHFLPLRDYEPGPDRAHHLVSRVGAPTRTVSVRRKLVDATYLENSVPATHRRGYEVAEGVDCVPPGELSRLCAPRSRYTVVGGGKTAMDACLWLLDHGVEPGRIRWVRPRDAWVLDRKNTQPGVHFGTMFEGLALQAAAAAAAESMEDLFTRLEEAGILLRLDPGVTPTMYRCATVNAREVPLLRSIEDVVRLGRVTRIERDRIVLQQGSVPAAPDDLYVDCSAVAFSALPVRPVFEPDRITIQPLRTCQPCFNAALIGHVEATRDDLAEKNRLCQVNPYPHRPPDWARMYLTGNLNEATWARDPQLSAFTKSTRLNATHGLSDYLDDPAVAGARTRLFATMPAAMKNLAKLMTTE